MNDDTTTALRFWAVRVITQPMSPGGQEMVQIYYVAAFTKEEAVATLAKKFPGSTVEAVSEVSAETFASYQTRTPEPGDNYPFA